MVNNGDIRYPPTFPFPPCVYYIWTLFRSLNSKQDGKYLLYRSTFPYRQLVKPEATSMLMYNNSHATRSGDNR